MWSDDAKGAVVNQPLKYDGQGLLAVRLVTLVQNGADYAPQDSSTITVFPIDTTVTLNDTANWIVKVGALWSSEEDTLWNTEKFPIKNPFPILTEILDTLQNFDDWIAMQVSIDSVHNTLDSLVLWLGYGPDCHAIKGRSGDRDTLHIMNGADSLKHLLYWHIGGVTGNTPDSVSIR